MADTETEPAIRVTVSVWLPTSVRCPAPTADAPVPHAAAAGSAQDTARRHHDRGFEDGAAAGAVLGRRAEALRWAEEVERWRRLVRWTAAQRDAE